jgi:hypothetical protein
MIRIAVWSLILGCAFAAQALANSTKIATASLALDSTARERFAFTGGFAAKEIVFHREALQLRRREVENREAQDFWQRFIWVASIFGVGGGFFLTWKRIKALEQTAKAAEQAAEFSHHDQMFQTFLQQFANAQEQTNIRIAAAIGLTRLSKAPSRLEKGSYPFQDEVINLFVETLRRETNDDVLQAVRRQLIEVGAPGLQVLVNMHREWYSADDAREGRLQHTPNLVEGIRSISEIIRKLREDSAQRWLDGRGLGNCVLQAANLWGAKLSNANLRHVDFRGANFWGANLEGADLSNADLSNADLRAVNLWDADLQDADLRGADLRQAGLRGADLRDADFRGVDLFGANLEGANLEGANFRGANLESANLEGAKLQEEVLPGDKHTEPRHVDLQEANWWDARISDAQREWLSHYFPVPESG